MNSNIPCDRQFIFKNIKNCKRIIENNHNYQSIIKNNLCKNKKQYYTFVSSIFIF